MFQRDYQFTVDFVWTTTRYVRIMIGVPDDLRPRKEEYELSVLHAKIWDVLELCWVKIPAEGLTIMSVVQRLWDSR